MPLIRQVLQYKPSGHRFRSIGSITVRTMSSAAQKPEIINREELKTEAKWLKMEKINWKDQDGKEVSCCRYTAAGS